MSSPSTILVVALALTGHAGAEPWPTEARSARAPRAVAVARAAGGEGRLGTLAAGTRVAWTRIAQTRDRCGTWLEIEPAGWVCAAEVTPSPEPPAPATTPAQQVDELLDRHFLEVAPGGAIAYATAADARRGRRDEGTKLRGGTFLRDTIRGFALSRRAVFVETLAGYIALGDLVVTSPSTFAGVELTAGALPLAWVVPAAGETAPVVAAPLRGGSSVGTVSRRERYPILERQAGFVRIGEDRWLAATDVRIAALAPRPQGVGASERWLDVDLDSNTLVAYEGDHPVYATLVSTGFGSTPVSKHRVTRKDTVRTLNNPTIALGTWSLPDVPFVIEFRKHYALHAVYWHDGFGTRRGHGCVNLSPRDARVIYEFTQPAAVDGWRQLFARGDEGTAIRIRDHAHPDPPWMPWASDPPVPTKPVK